MNNYKEVVEFLFEQYPSYQKKGVDAYKPDLSNIHGICKIIGNPQNKLKFIHVAGTNGKGSVCNFLFNIYQNTGYKVGLFTSPHLIDFRERILVGEKEISKEKSKKEFTKKCLFSSGLWTSFLTRPYSKIPDSQSEPSSIFITAMDTEPLSPNADIIIMNDQTAFEEGVKRISLLTNGNVFICKKENSEIRVNGFDTYEFAGPHPAGLSGTHMHFLDPPNANKTVWSINYQDVIAIGKLFLNGYIDINRTVSISGPLSSNPRLVKTVMGASLDDILEGEYNKVEDSRIISGSILSGFHASGDMAYLGKYSRQITIIKEDKEKHFFGWIKPQPNKYSVMPVLLSAFSFFKLFNLTSNLNGGRRAMVPTGVFESLMPQDFLPTQLLRSLLVMDTDVAQSLGALELDEEDIALCTFACPAKYEYGTALRDSLTKIEKEG